MIRRAAPCDSWPGGGVAAAQLLRFPPAPGGHFRCWLDGLSPCLNARPRSGRDAAGGGCWVPPSRLGFAESCSRAELSVGDGQHVVIGPTRRRRGCARAAPTPFRPIRPIPAALPEVGRCCGCCRRCGRPDPPCVGGAAREAEGEAGHD
jgi:hypothetical protein